MRIYDRVIRDPVIYDPVIHDSVTQHILKSFKRVVLAYLLVTN